MWGFAPVLSSNHRYTVYRFCFFFFFFVLSDVFSASNPLSHPWGQVKLPPLTALRSLGPGRLLTLLIWKRETRVSSYRGMRFGKDITIYRTETRLSGTEEYQSFLLCTVSPLHQLLGLKLKSGATTHYYGYYRSLLWTRDLTLGMRGFFVLFCFCLKKKNLRCHLATKHVSLL